MRARGWLERSPPKWMPVRRKRARQNKDLEPCSFAARWSTALGATAALLAGAAQAGAAGIDLPGTATVGPESRAVTLRLDCEPKTGIAATLTVPGFADLPFDFDGLEGPSGSTAPLTEMRIVTAAGVRTTRTRASGAVAADPATSFALTVAPARRGEAPLREAALALAEPGAKLVWTQGSPRKGDAPLIATFVVAEGQTAPVRAALGPCLQGF